MNVAMIIFGAAVLPGGRPSGTLLRRVEAAAAFGLAAGVGLYVPTGAVGRHGPSEASIMAGLLRQHGVEPARILLEETGTDTLSSVRACAALLRERGIGAVYAASSGYHLPRCMLLLRLAGLEARRCPPPPPDPSFLGRWYWRLREAAALPYDASLMIWLRLRGRGAP